MLEGITLYSKSPLYRIISIMSDKTRKGKERLEKAKANTSARSKSREGTFHVEESADPKLSKLQQKILEYKLVQENLELMLKSIQEKVSKLSEEFIEISTKVCSLENVLKSQTTEIQNKAEKDERRLGDIENAVRGIDADFVKLDKNFDNLDKTSVKRYENNIVIHGATFGESDWNINSVLIKLGVDRKEAEVIPFGLQTIQKSIPYLVKLNSPRQKMQVFQNCHKLRGSKISITDDMTPEQRQNRGHQMPTLIRLKAEGKKVYFKYDKLYVNGKLYDPASE